MLLWRLLALSFRSLGMNREASFRCLLRLDGNDVSDVLGPAAVMYGLWCAIAIPGCNLVRNGSSINRVGSYARLLLREAV